MAKKRKNKNVGLDEETWEIKPECGKPPKAGLIRKSVRKAAKEKEWQRTADTDGSDGT
jgi:hypothetical protein